MDALSFAEFNWLTAGMIFATYMAIDVLYALYIIAVSKRQAVVAATTGSALYTLAAFGVLTYSKNVLYIVPLALGAFLGTYLVVKYFKS